MSLCGHGIVLAGEIRVEISVLENDFTRKNLLSDIQHLGTRVQIGLAQGATDIFDSHHFMIPIICYWRSLSGREGFLPCK